MYFACSINGKLLNSIDRENLSYNSPKTTIRDNLKKYLVTDDILDGNQIMADCFPQINNFKVFISHSHADKQIAIQLANIIYKHTGAKSFIDSMVWNYADDLLKDIDKDYSLQRNGYYSYPQRNKTTSYVHMMLATALAQMMDKCDCIIFINTPNSLNKQVLNETTTFSPWIFYELATLHTLRVRMPSFDDGLEKLASGGKTIRAFSESQQPKITLPVNIENLYELTYDDINSLNDTDEVETKCSNVILYELYSKLEASQRKQSQIING